MVKSSKKLTKVLCLLLTMCLMTSMVVVTSMCTAQAQTTASPNALQNVILQALAIGDGDSDGTKKRNDFINDVLVASEKSETTDQQIIDSVKPYFIMNSDDILAGIDTYKNLSVNEKAIVHKVISDGYKVGQNVNVTKFSDVAKKINKMVTTDETNINGFRFTITLMLQMSINNSGDMKTLAYDLDSDVNKIEFKYTGIFKEKMEPLIPYVENLPGSIVNAEGSKVNAFLTAAQNALNNLNKGTQIQEFKVYLKGLDSSIYKGNAKPVIVSPSPSTGGGNTGGGNTGGGSTPSPSPTATVTTTATATVEPTPTAVIGEKDKQITSFSFKSIKPEAKGVIFENLRTIIVKVPVGTDIKSLEPTIEYKGASIKPESGDKKNFSHPVFYTVTAKDKSKARYVVIVLFGTPDVVVEPAPIMPGVGPYGDVFGHWAEDNLIGLIESGVITGYPDGSVKPNNDMTRAEVITVLVKALSLNAAEKVTLKFKDMKNIPAWAQGYVQVGLDKGFIQGYPDNTFKALSKVTRAEFTVMAMKAFGLGEEDNPAIKFADAKDVIPDWAKKFVAKATGLKIINGYDDNTFRPSNFITRAEVCAIIDRCVAAAASK